MSWFKQARLWLGKKKREKKSIAATALVSSRSKKVINVWSLPRQGIKVALHSWNPNVMPN